MPGNHGFNAGAIKAIKHRKVAFARNTENTLHILGLQTFNEQVASGFCHFHTIYKGFLSIYWVPQNSREII